MKCIKCGGKTYVTDIRTGQTNVPRRKRECAYCGTEFTTYEMPKIIHKPKDTLLEFIADRLIKHRLRLGMSQLELSRRAGVTPATIRRAEYCIGIRTDSLELIIQGLGLTPDEFFKE